MKTEYEIIRYAGTTLHVEYVMNADDAPEVVEFQQIGAGASLDRHVTLEHITERLVEHLESLQPEDFI